MCLSYRIICPQEGLRPGSGPGSGGPCEPQSRTGEALSPWALVSPMYRTPLVSRALGLPQCKAVGSLISRS